MQGGYKGRERCSKEKEEYMRGGFTRRKQVSNPKRKKKREISKGMIRRIGDKI